MSDATPVSAPDRLELTAEIVSAYVANNPLPTTELAALIASVHAALTHITDGTSTTPMKTTPDVAKPTPAQIRKSITPDVLISFEDGKSYKTLRRHLTLRGLTAEAYRVKWGLPSDYPMTAENYSAQRSALARSLGLGRKSASDAVPAQVDETSSEKPRRVGRPRKEMVSA